MRTRRSCSASTPEALLLGGASAGGNLTAGAVAQLQDAGEPVPAGLILVYPAVHPNGPEASAEVDLASPHGQLAMNFAGSARGSARPARVRRARAGRRIPVDARRRVREGRPASLGRGVRASARGCRHRGRRCTSSLVPATVTSTSRPTRPRCRRSRRSPSGSAHESADRRPDPRLACAERWTSRSSPTGLTPLQAAPSAPGRSPTRTGCGSPPSRPRVCAASSGRPPRG